MANDSRSVKLSRADEERAEALYGRKWRQLRRWIDRGERNNDPCPLLEPAKMPAWWSRNFQWRVPGEIEAAALNAVRTPDCAAQPEGAPNGGEPSTPAAAATIRPVNLEDFDPEEGDRLRELKQIQAAKFAELKERLRRGEESGFAESKYLKLCETVDKIETRVTERLKKRGLYILRDAVERDMAAAAELLRQSGASLARRVLERCPSLNADQRAQVNAAIDAVSAAQTRILARLSSFDNGSDLLRELELAA